MANLKGAAPTGPFPGGKNFWREFSQAKAGFNSGRANILRHPGGVPQIERSVYTNVLAHDPVPRNAAPKPEEIPPFSEF